VRVGQWGAFMDVSIKSLRRLTIPVEDEVPSGMLKLPALLHPVPTPPARSGCFTREDVDLGHHYNVWRLCRRGRPVRGGDIGVKLCGGDRGEVGGV
jgi:hypothetical protein